ncbi:hypothetical protein HF078_06925 [Bacillus sp. RO2]|uniref:hypothetical protein n=1 Tax=Bacillus sp. RO2 TaxID=2723913 RepID=UPI00145ECB15|nr:hypothetical protein [Bacillus sp. RO2]NMH72799.1 hypothetical protein [Bacillus sp. RO2]
MKKKSTIYSVITLIIFICILVIYGVVNNILVSNNRALTPEGVVEEYLTTLSKTGDFSEVLTIVDNDSMTPDLLKSFQNDAKDFKVLIYDVNEALCNENASECVVPTYLRLENSSGDMNYINVIKKENQWLISFDDIDENIDN